MTIGSGRGLDMIAAERIRQIKRHRYDSMHDDGHKHEELIDAAVAYLRPVWPEGKDSPVRDGAPENWPFEASSWKHGMCNTERLAKAGALIAAEIDRVLRAAERGHAPFQSMGLSHRIEAVIRRADVAAQSACIDDAGSFAKQVLAEAVEIIRDLERCSSRLGEAVAEMLIAGKRSDQSPGDKVVMFLKGKKAELGGFDQGGSDGY